MLLSEIFVGLFIGYTCYCNKKNQTNYHWGRLANTFDLRHFKNYYYGFYIFCNTSASF